MRCASGSMTTTASRPHRRALAAVLAVLAAAAVLAVPVPAHASDVGTLSGVVTAADGHPVSGLQVVFQSDDTAPNSAITDANGYWHGSVRAGDVYYAQLRDPAKVYLTDWITQGVTVTTAGAQVDYVATAGGVVTGTVRTPSGAVPHDRSVWVRRIAGSSFPLNVYDEGESRSESIAADGTFTVRQLPPGTYRLVASDSWDTTYAVQWWPSATLHEASAGTFEVVAGGTVTLTYDMFRLVSVSTLTARAGRHRARLHLAVAGSFRTVPVGSVRIRWTRDGRARTRLVSLAAGEVTVRLRHLDAGRQKFVARYLGSTTHRPSAKAVVRATVTV